MTLGGAAVEASLERSLKSITHVGYCVLDAVSEFGPIDIKIKGQ